MDSDPDLHAVSADYERVLDADLEALEGLDSAEAAEAAAAILQAHIEQLRSYEDEIRRLLADAIAERDARKGRIAPPES